MQNILVDQDLEVQITGLYQWPTYRGLIEGLPNRSLNLDILEHAIQSREKHTSINSYFLLNPALKPGEIVTPDKTITYESLPGIVCIAVTSCYQAFKDPEKYSSALVVIWLQDDYCFPIAEKIRSQLISLPWRERCEEFDWD